ncbi:hypothetical protein C2G38_2235419 [Gigaspora rosea]|uniref:Uncharacterized protein n=1 Tax=Gigaspora rosea TaxID=44941 RepID=A0A397TYC8_9GLOM|nr:hypothetical protein C2G38_2235419 [Gigaspora rosea]
MEAKQQENLKKLNDEMLTLFYNILSISTYENISLKSYVETKWIFDRNPTRIAYEKSFGSYDVSKCCQYVASPSSFMRLLFEDD